MSLFRNQFIIQPVNYDYYSKDIEMADVLIL